MRVFAFLLFAAAALAADVRNVSWGMSEAEVRAAEGVDPVDTKQVSGEQQVRYPITEFGQPNSSILYAFDHGKLVRATYVFAPEHAEPNDFIADFHAVTKELIARLGEPKIARNVWLDDSLQNERIAYLEQDRALPSDILPSDKLAGLSIAVGHLRMIITWDKPRTEIAHTMTGADHKIRHQIEFKSVEKFSAE